ncbi:MAG: histidine kinase N-terminal domain-containing protein [Coriobacteriia bacterium]|nr:histidine kinase N-terminal domain-containing protein [Coriobacteriia bacterium]
MRIILGMDDTATILHLLSEDAREHVRSVADNLQLVADLGYGDVALLVPDVDGELQVVLDARPMTAAAAVPVSQAGDSVSRDDEPEAYHALEGGVPVCSTRRRARRGIAFTSTAYPIGPADKPYAVVVRHVGQGVAESPGKMEVAFMRLAALLLERLQAEPLTDLDTDASYATTRLAGDGVIEVAEDGQVEYASPNAVNIMRLAGVEGQLTGSPASELPGGVSAVSPVLGSGAAREMTVEVSGRFLRYRTIALAEGALVLVEDVTEARHREQELRVKEATIREVHHRVKNNLQTVASLLRIQARRSESDEAARSLREAVDRVSSMAVVHEMLAEATEESVDLAAAVRTVGDMVRRGLAGTDSAVRVTVEGETGLVPAQIATSLALVVAELVHNAIEHGLGPGGAGIVTVTMQHAGSAVRILVHDTGANLPAGFAVESSAHLGLAIVRTIVEEDLRGTLSFGAAHGTTVAVEVPVPETTG